MLAQKVVAMGKIHALRKVVSDKHEPRKLTSF